MFAHEREQLLALLRDLEPSRWSLPTPCPAWDVHGLVVHLAGDDLGLLARQRDGHADGTAPDFAVDEHAFIADGVGRPGDIARIELTGDIERQWWLGRGASGWAFVDDADDRPALAAVLDADDAWRLLTNNLSKGRQRALDVRGAPELVRAVRRTRAIIGAPQ